MPTVTIYHNPRCTKSRQTLDLLRQRGLEPHIVEYLQQPPDEKTLRSLLKKLGIRAADLIRRNEPPYKQLKLAGKLDDEAALIAAMARHPILIQRPIVVAGGAARIGRPPESVLKIL